MKLFITLALIHTVLGGNIVRMPFINPAGVTYIDGAAHAGLAAGPVVPYAAAPAPTPFTFHQARLQHASIHAAPVSYSAPLTYPAAAAPLRYHAPVAYAAPHVKYAAVPTVHHVPSVADVPVTRIEAQPGVIQKHLDIAKPAIKTRKYEIRRPAIQKQFYDIEERVVVRPAGSALVELDEPLSKRQKGLATIQPAVALKAALPIPAAVPAVPIAPVAPLHQVVPYQRLHYATRLTPFGHYSFAASPVASHIQFTQYPLYNNFINSSISTTPVPPTQQPIGINNPSQDFGSPQLDVPQDDDTITVDNPEINIRSGDNIPSSTTEVNSIDNDQISETSESSEVIANQLSNTPAPENETPESRPQPESRSIGSPIGYRINPLDLIPQARFGSDVVPSLRNIRPEISQANQQRLIQLLTAQGGVVEIGNARSGPSISHVGEAGQVRARVLSATPAPEKTAPTDERVNTRRVVVSRPIETLQEIEVAEPVTKLERITVNHPTLFKTARQDFVRVPTSVPVYGKALAPVAATLPVYQKAVAPVLSTPVNYYG